MHPSSICTFKCIVRGWGSVRVKDGGWGLQKTYSWIKINLIHRPHLNSMTVPTLFCTERVFG